MNSLIAIRPTYLEKVADALSRQGRSGAVDGGRRVGIAVVAIVPVALADVSGARPPPVLPVLWSFSPFASPLGRVFLQFAVI